MNTHTSSSSRVHHSLNLLERAVFHTVKLPAYSNSPQFSPSLSFRAGSVTWGGSAPCGLRCYIWAPTAEGKYEREDRAELSTRAKEPALASRGAKCSGGACMVPLLIIFTLYYPLCYFKHVEKLYRFSDVLDHLVVWNAIMHMSNAQFPLLSNRVCSSVFIFNWILWKLVL